MTLGPIDFIALEFPGNRFRGDILPDLFELVDKEIIRIIDLVIIMKYQGGRLPFESCASSIPRMSNCSAR